MEQLISQDPECKTLKEMLLYKMDRTIVVLGVVGLSAYAFYLRTPETIAAGSLGIGALAAYLGAKGK